MKSVREVLRAGAGTLQTLTAQSARREALNAILDGFLDTPFRSHVQVASATGGTLVLCADSPTWGHRVRYLAPSILDHFRLQGVQGLERVTISVRQGSPAPSRAPPGSRPTLSAAGASVLESAAANLDDPELARRLRAIARHREDGG